MFILKTYSLSQEFVKKDDIPEPKQSVCSLPLFCDSYQLAANPM